MRKEVAARFQIIKETGLDADFTSGTYTAMGFAFAATYKGEHEVRRGLREMMKLIRTYREHLYLRIGQAKLHDTEFIPELINEENECAVERLDQISRDLRAMAKLKPEELNLFVMRELYLETLILVYGKSKEENLRNIWSGSFGFEKH